MSSGYDFFAVKFKIVKFDVQRVLRVWCLCDYNEILKNMTKKLEIRNSTAEFLIFQLETKNQGVEVFYKNENVWCTQKAMAQLFDCDRSVITKHLGNIFESGELKEEAVCANLAHTASDGKSYHTVVL